MTQARIQPGRSAIAWAAAACLVVCALLVGVVAWPRGGEEGLIVFAGSASRPVTERVAALFEQETGVPVRTHFGGSGRVLAQLRLSGRGDVYFPGSSDYLEKARALGLVEAGTTRTVAYLVPAVIVAKGNPHGIRRLADLSRPGLRVAIADPHSVCVGLYAVELLDHNGLAEAVKPNIVTYAPSCEHTANLVALHAVDASLGWRVLARWSSDRVEAIMPEPHEIPRLGYLAAAVTTASRRPELAQRFVDFLASSQVDRMFAEAGYLAGRQEALSLAPGARLGGGYELSEGW